jgi:hypothetical protein
MGKIRDLEGKAEKERVREQAQAKLDKEKAEREAKEKLAYSKKIMAMREEKDAKKKLIAEQKLKLQVRAPLPVVALDRASLTSPPQFSRKEEWHEQLRKQKMVEDLKEKRAAALAEMKERKREEGRRRELETSKVVQRSEGLLASVKQQFDKRHAGKREDASWTHGGAESEENFFTEFNVSYAGGSPFKVDVDVDSLGKTSPVSPVTPYDFFHKHNLGLNLDEVNEVKQEEKKEGEGGAEGVDGKTQRSGASQSTEATFKHSNKTPVKAATSEGGEGDEGDEGEEGEGGEEEDEFAGLHTPGVPGLVSDKKNSPPKRVDREGDPFSSPPPKFDVDGEISKSALKRGFSFAYKPSELPSEDEIERMSPLQRTYTALKLKRGEDPGIARMKELISTATG